MKTHTLSVNTLTRNLTSERHNNCASCLGLILPIRWVTPPPNFCLECFLLVLHLQSLHFLFVFNVNMASCLSSMYWFGFCPLQHSLIAMANCWIFWTKWMWSDPNLSMLSISNSISPSYAFYWNCRMSSLRSCQQKIQRQPLSPFSMLIPPHETRRSRNDHLTIQACVGRGTNPKIPHNGHVFLRCESPGAPV